MAPRGKKGQFISKKEATRRETGVANLKVFHDKKKTAEERKKKAAAKIGTLVEVGRRVVSLDVFAQNMWCLECDVPLSLRFMEEEKRVGLASTFFIRCYSCLAVKQVESDRPAPAPEGCSRPLSSVNCKSALGCLDTGIGHEQINNWLSCLNLPTFDRKTLKRAEERVGQCLESVAQQSCQDAIIQEREMTLQNSAPRSLDSTCDSTSADDPVDPAVPTTPRARPRVPLSIKYDFGWQKRGHGRAYDSHSGQGSAIGWYSNKILAFEALSKYCAMCSRGHQPGDHQCAKNYEGSSKGMEPVAAVNMLLHNKSFEEASVCLGTLVGDADSSTMAAIRRESPYPVNKILDKNHGLKGFANQLWKLKLKKKHSFLDKNMITHLKMCVGYAIAQHKDDVEGTRSAIMNVLAHVFGDHEKCEDWCKAKGNEENYEFKHFPGKVPFSCPIWKKDFGQLLENFAEDAEQLAPNGSTQQCESFNHMVATRAPKSRHYCGTSANRLRITAAVATKNLGAEHIDQVFKKAALSPSVTKYRAALQKKREAKALYQQQIVVKRRRLHLKMKKDWCEATKRRAEGASYASGMGTVMERAVAATGPSSWVPPHQPLLPDCEVVIVDTETTGFSADDEIFQVAAQCNDASFSVFMMPSVAICSDASNVTGFRTCAGKLLYRGKEVATTPSYEAAHLFLAFLSECGRQVLVVGHNLIRFDAPRIVKWLRKHNLVEDFCQIVYGFTCTMPLLKQDKIGKQNDLAKTFLTGPEWAEDVKGAHNAVSDCRVLQGLLQHFAVSKGALFDKAKTAHNFFNDMVISRRRKMNMKALAPLSATLSNHMIGKMAGAGVTLKHLRDEHQRHGREGLEICLGVRIDGKPRVTTNKNIITKLDEYLTSNPE